MIIHRKIKPKPHYDEIRTRMHFCLLPFITPKIIIWGTHIEITEKYEYDPVIGIYKWKKKSIKVFNNRTGIVEEISLV